MNLFSVSVVKSSINCASLNGPNVVTDNTCVSPRVNNAEPCTRGSKSTCESSGRSSSNPRPSGRIFSSEIKRRTSPASTSTPYSCACLTAFSRALSSSHSNLATSSSISAINSSILP